MVPEQSIVPKINEHLPPEIRVIGEFNMKLRCYERLKSMQKRVFLTAFFKNREQMVEQVVKYFFSQNPFPVSEFAYCDRKCVKFDT